VIRKTKAMMRKCTMKIRSYMKSLNARDDIGARVLVMLELAYGIRY
jgi:hypothetical protein